MYLDVSITESHSQNSPFNVELADHHITPTFPEGEKEEERESPFHIQPNMPMICKLLKNYFTIHLLKLHMLMLTYLSHQTDAAYMLVCYSTIIIAFCF